MYKEIVLSVTKTSLPLMIVLIILQYIFRKQSTCILIEFHVAYSIVRMMPLVNSMHTLGIKGIITLINVDPVSRTLNKKALKND